MNESFNEEWETIFRRKGLQSIKKLGNYFIKETDIEVKENIADFLLMSAHNSFFPFAIVLSTIHILREYSQTTNDAISLSKRAVMGWRHNYSIRYTLANCLNMTEKRECYLEALKQRIIGCNLEVFNAQKRKNTNFEELQRIIPRHFGRLDQIKSFLDGDRKYPSKHVGKMVCARRQADDDVLRILRKLEPIGDLFNLPHPSIKTPKIVCILDTNAISNIEVSEHLMNAHIHYKIPAEILLELANWNKLQRIPWELDAVEICDVANKIPPEIENMFSKIKGKPPSIADKKVAALAYEVKADAIISNDRDLWDSGVDYQIEKNLGHRIQIIRPHYFNNWLKKHNLLNDDSFLNE